MHSTAFMSFPKPFALILACDTAKFRQTLIQRRVITGKWVKFCAIRLLLKSDRDQVMKKNNNIFFGFALFGISQAYILANSNRDFTH
ncbi:hypothetical protein APT61_08615 [Leclercia adecarboxylata]|nr:hypothetical protein APT61_08615 [Leclercia adecarboxylata]